MNILFEYNLWLHITCFPLINPIEPWFSFCLVLKFRVQTCPTSAVKYSEISSWSSWRLLLMFKKNAWLVAKAGGFLVKESSLPRTPVQRGECVKPPTFKHEKSWPREFDAAELFQPASCFSLIQSTTVGIPVQRNRSRYHEMSQGFKTPSSDSSDQDFQIATKKSSPSS